MGGKQAAKKVLVLGAGGKIAHWAIEMLANKPGWSSRSSCGMLES